MFDIDLTATNIPAVGEGRPLLDLSRNQNMKYK